MVDVVSRYWLSTVLAPEETWVQDETGFIAALEADGGKGWLLEDTNLAQDNASQLVRHQPQDLRSESGNVGVSSSGEVAVIPTGSVVLRRSAR